MVVPLSLSQGKDRDVDLAHRAYAKAGVTQLAGSPSQGVTNSAIVP